MNITTDKTESITITPAANGYIVSKFASETPDRLFLNFERLVDYLREQLPIFYPNLFPGGRYPGPGQEVQGSAFTTEYQPPPPEPVGLKTPPTWEKCRSSVARGGAGCILCDDPPFCGPPKTIF